MHAKAGATDEALKVYQKALAMDERNPEVHYHYGSVNYALGNEQEAQASLKIAADSSNDFRGVDEARQRLEITDHEPHCTRFDDEPVPDIYFDFPVTAAPP